MSNRTVQIKLLVTPEENEQIRKNAMACDRVLSAYVREMAMNMYVLKYDLDSVTEHTKEISKLSQCINPLVYTICRIGNYFPADLEYILERMNKIYELERQFLQNDFEFHNEIRAQLAETVRTVVGQHLSKNLNKSPK